MEDLHIIILCENSCTETVQNTVSKITSLSTTYIVYGDKIDAKNNQHNNKILKLPNGTDIEAAIRATFIWLPRMLGLQLEYLVFCNANNLPYSEELIEVVYKLRENEMCLVSKNVWGMSLSNAVLFGWGAEKRCFTSVLSKLELTSGIANALRGELVSEEIMINATQEVMPSKILTYSTFGALNNATHLRCIANNISNTKTRSVNESNGYITTSDDITPKLLISVRANLGEYDVIGIVLKCNDNEYQNHIPFRTIVSSTGIQIKIYSRLKPEEFTQICTNKIDANKINTQT